ncbi:MAG: DNA-binding response regulator, partial [Paenibacillus sp.]|nr:DNA-binding response regulator [Paenibacillus sp.]
MSSVMRVLIVDDHPVMVKATTAILEQIEGIEVIGKAGNGKMCLEFIQQHQPDMVFLDYHLPDQFGSNVAKQIKERYPKMHIVIFTGIDVADMYNHLLDLGVSGIISKESSESVVRNMVCCILDGYTAVPLSQYRHMRLVAKGTSDEVVLSNDEVQIMSM